MSGKVYLVGAGPSDAGLLTLKGYELLQTADVVVHDALVGGEVLGLIPPETRRVDVGKHAGNHPVPQEEINRILLREALEGHTVVRLKGGDPFLFGRGGEELELLAERGVPFEVVPGVTSAVAVPAYAGIPVTHRDCCSSVHIITGHTKKSPGARTDYRALVRLGGTLVFLMGVAALEELCAGLLGGGIDPATPAAILERGTTARQRRISGTVETLHQKAREAEVGTPAVIVVGEVCALAERFSWAEKRPLGGRRVIVTRPRKLASRMTAKLRALGAEVLELPSIVTEPVAPNPALDEALARIGEYGWLVFTSPTGVRVFLEHLRETRFDLRRLGGVRLAAIGPSTAGALEERGLLPALLPERAYAAALGAALAERAAGERVLICRARQGSPELTRALDAAGISYDDLPLYETRYAHPDAKRAAELLDAGEIDYVAFMSASTVRGFVETLGKRDYREVRAVCIGESTAAAAREYGMKIEIAGEPSIDAMADRMAELSEKERKGYGAY